MTKLLDSSKTISDVKLDLGFISPFKIKCSKGFKSFSYGEKDIETLQVMEEEEYRSAGKAAAWGIAGGVLTGGIGLAAAGAFGARRRSDTVFMIKFKDGNWVAFLEKNGKPLKKLKEYALKQRISAEAKSLDAE